MTIRVYQSTDTDAPVLTGEAGSLKTVIKACNNGYGSQSGMGWDVLFEDTNKIALKSSAIDATGCVVRFDDGGAKWTDIKCYHDMSDIDTGTGRWGRDPQYLRKWYAGSATAAKAWTVVASDKAFYIFTQYYGGKTANDMYFFGDFTSFAAADNYNCLAVGSAATQAYMADPIFVGNRQYRTATDAANLNANAMTGFATIGSINNNGYNNLVYPSTISNGAAFFPVYLYQEFAGSQDYRGIMPGLMLTPFAIRATLPDNTILTNVAGLPTGQRLLIKHASSNDNTAVAVNIDEWL